MWPPELPPLPSKSFSTVNNFSLSLPLWCLVVGACFPLGPVWLWLAIWNMSSLLHSIATYKNTLRTKRLKSHPNTGERSLIYRGAIICRKVQVRCCCPCMAQWVQLLRWKKSCNRLRRASGVEYTWLAEGASGITGLRCNTGLTSSSSTLVFPLNATKAQGSHFDIT